jgi:ppGpp synthetase/RelA/SpoT-type nucleotidyltranferase
MKNKYLIYIKYIKKLKMNYTNLRKNLNTTNIIKKTIAIQGVVKKPKEIIEKGY